jgi:hypothetical protein
MLTDTHRTECTLDDDPRLIAGFGAIVSAGARRAGLTDCDQENFTAVVNECCREAFALIARPAPRDSAPTLHIAVADLPGRVEVTIEYAGEALPPARRDSLCGCAAGSPRDARVDSAQCETHDGRSRVALIKNCAAVKARTIE